MKPQKWKKPLAVLPFVLLLTVGCSVTKKSTQTSNRQATATQYRQSDSSRSDSLIATTAEQQVELVDSTTRTILLVEQRTYRRRAAAQKTEDHAILRQADSTATVRDSTLLVREQSAAVTKKRPAGRWLVPVLAGLLAVLLLCSKTVRKATWGTLKNLLV